MRLFTLASFTAAALALGLITAVPSQAQTPQPATKSDKMAPAPKAAPSTDTKMAPAKKEPLDINTASQKDLDALPGIGQAYSAAIIKGRPYNGKDDIVNRNIVPQKTYDGIKDMIIAKQAPKSQKKG